MSMSAEYHARLWLSQGHSVEEVKAEIVSLKEYQEHAIKNYGPGMDGGCSRSVDWAASKIRIFEQYLKFFAK